MFEPIKCELTKNDIKDFCTFSTGIERILKSYFFVTGKFFVVSASQQNSNSLFFKVINQISRLRIFSRKFFKKLSNNIPLVIVITACVMAIIFSVMEALTTIPVPVIMTAFLFFTLIYLLLNSLDIKFFAKTLMAAERTQQLSKLLDVSDSWNSEIYISDDGITKKDNHKKSKWEYSSIVDIYKTENFLYVYVSFYEALIIPKRALKDEETFNDIYNFLENKISISPPKIICKYMFEPIKYELSDKDIKDFAVFLMGIDKFRKIYLGKNFEKIFLIIFVIYSVGFPIMLTGLPGNLDYPYLSKDPFEWMCCIIFLSAAFFHKSFFTTIIADKLYADYKYSDTLSGKIYIFDNFIITKDNHKEIKWEYSSIVEIFKTENSLYLYVSPSETFIIPKRFFKDEETFNDVYKFLSDKICPNKISQ